jgi:uncharacterized protein (TIGR04222 family)
MFLPLINGPEFIALFIALWGLLFFCSLITVTLAPFFFVSNTPPDTRLNREELAYLARGTHGAVDCTLIYLGTTGTLHLNDNVTITKTKIPTANLSPLEHKIASLMVPGQTGSIAELRSLSKSMPEMEMIRKRLESLKLLVSGSARSRFSYSYCSLATALTGFGILRLVSGIQHTEAVGFLVSCLLVFPILAWILSFNFSNRLKARTFNGIKVLAEQRQIHAELKIGAQLLNAPKHAPNIGLAVALFGVAAIGASTNPWSKALAAPSASSDVGSSSDSSSCSSASSDSGSSSSCSGGGGCGGCGGGGD